MNMLRHVAFVAGVVLIVLLVSRLPADVFASTRAFLVLAAGALFLLFALSIAFLPVRRALGGYFGFTVRGEGTLVIAREDEWRELLRVVFAALVCLAVAALATIVRA